MSATGSSPSFTVNGTSFIALDAEKADLAVEKPTIRTGFHIIKGLDDTTRYLGFNGFYTMRVLERL